MTNINQAVELKENNNMALPIRNRSCVSGTVSSNNSNERMDALSPQPAPKLQKSKILQAVFVIIFD